MKLKWPPSNWSFNLLYTTDPVDSARLAGGFEFPAPGIGQLAKHPTYMGQELLNPPSVEGWHTGVEWINSGSLMQRVNFTAELVGDVRRPGIKVIVDRLQAQGTRTTAVIFPAASQVIRVTRLKPAGGQRKSNACMNGPVPGYVCERTIQRFGTGV